MSRFYLWMLWHIPGYWSKNQSTCLPLFFKLFQMLTDALTPYGCKAQIMWVICVTHDKCLSLILVFSIYLSEHIRKNILRKYRLILNIIYFSTPPAWEASISLILLSLDVFQPFCSVLRCKNGIDTSHCQDRERKRSYLDLIRFSRGS